MIWRDSKGHAARLGRLRPDARASTLFPCPHPVSRAHTRPAARLTDSTRRPLAPPPLTTRMQAGTVCARSAAPQQLQQVAAADGSNAICPTLDLLLQHLAITLATYVRNN
jgi:hypothetical protein